MVHNDLFLSCVGSPRHKLHQTELSGFKVFRPVTQDLLFKPRGNYSRTATVSAHTRQLLQSSRPTSILSSTVPLSRLKPSPNKEYTRKLTFDRTMNSLAPTGSLSTKQKQVSKSSERTEQVLPELIQQSPVKEDSSANSHFKQSQPKLHLPAIVSS